MMPEHSTPTVKNKTPRICGVFETAFCRTKWEGVFDARTLDHSLFKGLTAPLTPCKVVED